MTKKLETQGITFPKSLRKPLFQNNNDVGPGDYDLKSTLFDHQQWKGIYKNIKSSIRPYIPRI